jgi:hypothetical protein
LKPNFLDRPGVGQVCPAPAYWRCGEDGLRVTGREFNIAPVAINPVGCVARPIDLFIDT